MWFNADGEMGAVIVMKRDVFSRWVAMPGQILEIRRENWWTESEWDRALQERQLIKVGGGQEGAWERV